MWVYTVYQETILLKAKYITDCNYRSGAPLASQYLLVSSEKQIVCNVRVKFVDASLCAPQLFLFPSKFGCSVRYSHTCSAALCSTDYNQLICIANMFWKNVPWQHFVPIHVL